MHTKPMFFSVVFLLSNINIFSNSDASCVNKWVRSGWFIEGGEKYKELPICTAFKQQFLTQD